VSDSPSEGPRLPFGARLFANAQGALPQHALSRIVLRLTRIRARVLKNLLIQSFVTSYRPSMSEAAEPDPLRYGSFNEFFTRALKAGARPIDAARERVVSPVDGTISQIGYLAERELLQAKGQMFGLDALLGAHSSWSERFAGGAYATLYLAPYNYHRVHMPLPGLLQAAWYVPGRLFSVNAASVRAVPGLFARNERVACVFEHSGLPFAVVLIGALFVGSISTIWHGDVTPRRPRRVVQLTRPVTAPDTLLEKGEEMGRFNMGSTVILLFPRDSIEWSSALRPGMPVEVGQPLGRVRGG
jgi:phosphatidylserine decarboxylase